MSVEVFHGSWQIVECVNISNCRNIVPARIEGAVFVLQDNGEIKWELGPDVDASFPLFQCDCYEVVHAFVGVCIQMGAVSGHMFEFWVDRPVPRDMMLLTFEGWCMIQCHQIPASHPPLDFPFSFLPALEEGYFSDMKVPLSGERTEEEPAAAANETEEDCANNEFKVHSIVFELSACDPNLVSNLPPEVLEIVLHYIYSQSLPETLPLSLARQCKDEAPRDMKDFISLCENYIHRASLKAKIVHLVNQVHSCAEAMASAFRDHSVISPTRFCYVIKLALKDAAVAFMKLVELCVLYGEEAPVLNRSERLEILRYAKTRLPIFLTQFVALLRTVNSDFSSVKPSERNDIAAHIVPEIESLLEALSTLMREARDACSEIWARWSSQRSEDNKSGENSSSSVSMDSLTEALMGIFRKREVLKLHHVQGQLAAIYLYLAQKKENFEEMTTAVKIRCVSRNLEQLLEELPVFLLRLEEIMIAFDDRFQWKDFKFCLQLAISQVYQTVEHLRKEKTQLQKFFTCFSQLVQRDEFHQSLVSLGLLEVPSEEETGPAVEDSGVRHGQVEATVLQASSSEDRYDDLNLIESLCTPRKAGLSLLAKNSTVLFETKKDADMVFEIAQDGDAPLEIPGHRALIAARCDWFRRALLSGMKESIQKRIVIHDCSSSVFQLFLSFLYTGQISKVDATLETMSELIALADRYEMDILKLYCEQELAVRHLDETSVIFLLSMADQFNARTLRAASMDYIASNPGIMAKEMFEELSPELQMEVYDITMWTKPKKVFSIPEEMLSCPRYMLVPGSPTSEDDEEEEDEDDSSDNASPSTARRLLH